MNPKLIGEQQQKHPAFKLFIEAMEGRHYGEEETLDAWHWFCAGWTSAYSYITAGEF